MRSGWPAFKERLARAYWRFVVQHTVEGHGADYAYAVREMAESRGQAFASLDDLALVCLEDWDVDQLLRAHGTTALDVTRMLRTLLAPIDPRADRSLSDGGEVSAVTRVIARTARRLATPRARLAGRDVFATCAASDHDGGELVRDALIACQVDRAALLRAANALPVPRAPGVQLARDAHTSIVVHNDDVTTQEFVVQLLVEVFGYNEQAATDVMRDIHTEGKREVWSGPFADADALLERALSRIGVAGFPLALTLVAEEPARE